MKEFLQQTRLVFRREFNALLTSPLFYILTGIFFLLTSTLYVTMLYAFARGTNEDMTVNVTDSVIRPTFHMVHFFLLVQIPLMTMRVFAEDRSTGMLDLLQTTPVRDWSLLLGKFLGMTAGIGLYVLLTVAYPAATAALGAVEWPVVIGSLIALVLSTAAYVALGIFFSSLTESQVVAAVLSYVSLFILVFSQAFADGTDAGAVQETLRHFAAQEHITMILSGNIAPMNLVYFIAVTGVALFLTARTLEARRWRA